MYLEYTPLHLAVLSNQQPHLYSEIKELLDNGVNVNPMALGQTPLALALMQRPLSLVQLLIERGANLDVVSDTGKTALHFAAMNPSIAVLRYVLERGVDANAENERGRNALCYAAMSYRYENCKLLLENYPLSSSKLRFALDLLLGDQRERRRGLPAFYFSDDILVMNVAEMKKAVCLLIEHLTLTEHREGKEVQKELAEVQGFDTFAEHYERCKFELGCMKHLKIYNNVSLFDVFLAEGSALAGLCRNEDIVAAVDDIDETRFPIYFELLKKKFDAQVERQKCYKLIAPFLSAVFGFADPHHLAIQTIMDFLADENVKSLAGLL